MTIIFFGNTKYSIIGAKILHKTFPISLFVTIPASPVSDLAKQLKIPSLLAKQLDEETVSQIKKYNADFLVVEDYRLILPEKLLKVPKFAPLNIHHSLLPKYRGPSPAPFAILNGEKISGVSIIKMTDEVDGGDTLAWQQYTLAENETTYSLLIKLNELGGKLVVSLIKKYLKGKVKAVPQDHTKATFTKLLKKEDGYFEIDSPPPTEKLDRMIRAFYPWPGVWTLFRPTGSKGQARIVKFLPEGLVQMEGKKVMPIRDFLNGYPDFPLKTL